jgi:hypothetical protein
MSGDFEPEDMVDTDTSGKRTLEESIAGDVVKRIMPGILRDATNITDTDDRLDRMVRQATEQRGAMDEVAQMFTPGADGAAHRQ